VRDRLPATAGTFTQPGATTGVPAGFVPPPGLYFGNAANYGIGQNLTALPNTGDTTAVGVEVPFFIWSPGWNFLGAQYAASVAFPFVDVAVRQPGHGAGNAGPVAGGVNADLYLRAPFNPAINPFTFSWNLGNGLAVSFGEVIYIPINTEVTIDSGGGTVTSAAAFEQRVAVSYIGNDWIASANTTFGIVTKDAAGVSGPDYINVDLTLAHNFGKWTVGVIGYGTFDINQTPVNTTAAGGFSPNEEIGFGGLLGYNFGPVDLTLRLTHEFVTKGVDSNYGRYDTRVWTTLVIPIWNPTPPPPVKPVIAKY
jgi:hypothetical protein